MAQALDKQRLLDEVIGLVKADAEALEAAQRSAIEGATHEEAKPENDKDTRGLEQSYLARGQAMRVEALRGELALLQKLKLHRFTDADSISLSALVTLDDDGDQRVVFLLPAGAGKALAKRAVQVVTTAAPLGEALLGKKVGDGFELRIGPRMREIEVISIC